MKVEKELLPCPFCGSEIRIVVCDDEGNIHDVVDTQIVGRNFDDIYGEYEGFCVMEGIRESMIARRNFSKEICSRVEGLEKSRLNDAKRSTTYKWT